MFCLIEVTFVEQKLSSRAEFRYTIQLSVKRKCVSEDSNHPGDPDLFIASLSGSLRLSNAVTRSCINSARLGERVRLHVDWVLYFSYKARIHNGTR